MKNDFIYMGCADHADNTFETPWQFLPNTYEAILEGINKGYTAKSIYSLSHEPLKEKEVPLRKGDLLLDFDCKENPAEAISSARIFIYEILYRKFLVYPQDLQYWISGGKGCHIAIPSSLFGGEEGDAWLPLIHKCMVFMMLNSDKKIKYQIEKHIDFSLYCMGKGKLLRIENIKRANGRYKVPVTYEEFIDFPVDALLNLSNQPRNINYNHISGQNYCLANMYKSVSKELIFNGIKNRFTTIENLFSCDFIAHCFQDQSVLPEPEWFVMIAVFKKMLKNYRNTIHCFSCQYPDYSPEKTDEKIAHAKPCSISCEYIHSLGFTCSKDCGVDSPIYIWRKNMKDHIQQSSRYESREDGLYYIENYDTKLCSPLKMVAKASTIDDDEWYRIIEVKNPNGVWKPLLLPMPIIIKKDELISKLLENGVELESYSSQFINLIRNYIGTALVDKKSKILVKHSGWINDDTYVLPDQNFGTHLDRDIYFLDQYDHKFNVSGTLEDWKSNIGIYCPGNPSLILALSYAFTPPLLKILDLESGGIHLQGGTSKGKSTLALCSSSIWGGGDHGYHYQWRATHNAIENIAYQHNDALLVLDEIGQATSETVSDVSYMLSNCQGKARMNADSSPKKMKTWRLNFISTGEQTIGDKIEESGRMKVKGGQETRVIDIPLDQCCGKNAFQDLHGLESSQQMSDLLKKNSNLYYGTAIREFLSNFCSNREYYISRIYEIMSRFEQVNTTPDSSSQVLRVLKKFALIVACGVVASEMNILPVSEDEICKSITLWFNVWITARNGRESSEYISVLRRIKEHFEKQDHRYCHKDDVNRYQREDLAGFYETSSSHGERSYFAFNSTVNELFKGVDRTSIIELLLAKGYIGSINSHNREIKSWKGRSVCGLTFYPYKWRDED